MCITSQHLISLIEFLILALVEKRKIPTVMKSARPLNCQPISKRVTLCNSEKLKEQLPLTTYSQEFQGRENIILSQVRGSTSSASSEEWNRYISTIKQYHREHPS